MHSNAHIHAHTCTHMYTTLSHMTHVHTQATDTCIHSHTTYTCTHTHTILLCPCTHTDHIHTYTLTCTCTHTSTHTQMCRPSWIQWSSKSLFTCHLREICCMKPFIIFSLLKSPCCNISQKCEIFIAVVLSLNHAGICVFTCWESISPATV